jgi:SNF2 family DNA or RNA helicase
MQKEDTKKLGVWGRALADLPVGYGKTAISTAAALMRQPETVVVLLPPILIPQWVAWLRSIPDIGMVVPYEGDPRQRAAIIVRGVRWLVMSYGIFKNDYARLKQDLKDSVVLTLVDESHCIKNASSMMFKRVREFSMGQDLFLMTGTPMSTPADGYAYVKLNTPEIYRTFTHFENIHVAEKNFFGGVERWQNLDMLKDNLNLRRVYRTKEEVHADLPKANYMPIYYELSKDHKKLYQKLMTEQILEMENGGKIDASTAQLLYHYSQQIIANFGYFADDESKRSTLYDLVDEVCDEISLGRQANVDLGLPPASKLIIWTQYKITSARMLAYMQAKVKAVAAYGGANSKESVRLFLTDPATVALVAQPKSAGVGLNPQHLCWEMLFTEIPLSVIEWVQASGRIDRHGQKYNPNIRLAVAKGTIQEALVSDLIKKDELVKKASGNLKGIKELIFP